MQCNALNIKTVAKQVWFYFIHGTTRPGHAGTIMNLQIVLNTPKNPYLNQATPKKILAKISLPKKIPKLRISNPKKSFDHPCQLGSRVPTSHPPLRLLCLLIKFYGFAIQTKLLYQSFHLVLFVFQHLRK